MTAVDREADWLRASGDGLPTLLADPNAEDGGGPWQVVQGYWGRTPQMRKTGIYVTRQQVAEVRWSNQRKRQTHHLRLKLIWPMGTTTVAENLWENEQRAFEDAVDLVIARVRGTVLDHTHGGRFMSVAEAPDPAQIAVAFGDPEMTLAAQTAHLRADMTYSADDRDFTA